MKPADKLATTSQESSSAQQAYLTAGEFLAQVEAHKKAREMEGLNPPNPPGPAATSRVYQLDLDVKYEAKRVVPPSLEVPHE